MSLCAKLSIQSIPECVTLSPFLFLDHLTRLTLPELLTLKQYILAAHASLIEQELTIANFEKLIILERKCSYFIRITNLEIAKRKEIQL